MLYDDKKHSRGETFVFIAHSHKTMLNPYENSWAANLQQFFPRKISKNYLPLIKGTKIMKIHCLTRKKYSNDLIRESTYCKSLKFSDCFSLVELSLAKVTPPRVGFLFCSESHAL